MLLCSIGSGLVHATGSIIGMTGRQQVIGTVLPPFLVTIADALARTLGTLDVGIPSAIPRAQEVFASSRTLPR